MYKHYIGPHTRLFDAYDGSPYPMDVSVGPRIDFLDLSVPQFGIPLYDWVLCTEVAEHIPDKYESVFLSNIVRHAKEGIILSWAKVGQKGNGHVNCQPPEYVLGKLTEAGFMYDEKASNTLREASTFSWFKSNLMVFHRVQKIDATLA
eukprot:GHVO01039022.1.p2 GENE.GHVO01039022.1~~GHVO01039022.1.p2  ORF type:complete len:148 (+),score=23.37 GHVO01039022.1:378-821(+)